MVDSANDQELPSEEAEQVIFEDHIALIHETPEERLSAVTLLLRVGLEKGELCLYISSRADNQDIVEALRAQNIDVEKAISSGGLILTNMREVFFKLGRFDPDWTIRVIGNMAELAKKYQFTAIRVISEMAWTLEKVPGVEKWPEYEAKLNTLDPGIPLRVICQYDRQAFPPEVLMFAIKTHPKVVSHGAINKNPFYLPADSLLKGDYARLDLEKMLDTIAVSSHAEAELQDRERSLVQLNRQLEEEAVARKSLEQAVDESQRMTEEKVAEVESRDQRIQTLEQDIAVLKGSQEERDAALASLQEELRANQQEMAKAGEALDRLREALRSREEEVNATRAAIEQGSAELESLRSALEDEKAARSAAVSTSAQREEELRTREDERRLAAERLEAELREARESLGSQSQELVGARDAIRQLEEKIALLESGRAETQKALDEAREALAANERELSAGRAGAETAAEEIARLRSDLAAKEALLSETVGMCEGVKADAAMRAEELIEAAESRERLRQDIERLNAALSDKDSLLSQLHAGNDELTAARADLSMKEMALSASQAQVERISAELNGSRTQMDELSAAVRKGEDELTEKRNAIGEAQAALRGREAELSELRAALLAVQEELRAAKSALSDRESEIARGAAALDESDRRFRALFEQAGVGIARMDLEGRLLEANAKFHDMLGCAPGALDGRSFRDFTHRDDLASCASMHCRIASGEASASSGTIRYVRKLGASIWVNVSMSLVRDPRGLPSYVMAVIEDRTEQMLAEQLLREKEDKERESAERAEKEDSSAASLAEAERAPSWLTAAINALPDAAIILAVDGKILLANPAAERKLGVDRLAGLCAKDLWPDVAFNDPAGSKIEVCGKELELRPYELKDGGKVTGTVITIREAAPLTEAVPEVPQAGQRPAEDLAHDLNDSLTVIMGSVSLAKEYVIPEGRMYNKLKQIETASAAARDLASRLISSKGEMSQPTELSDAALLKGKGRLLLMDDDESVLEATGDLLRYLGYTVDVARDGEEALEMCREARKASQPFELAILDLGIASGMGGKEAGLKLRGENPELRLIVSSGFTWDPILLHPRENGFDAAIPKPYAADALSKAVADVLAQRK